MLFNLSADACGIGTFFAQMDSPGSRKIVLCSTSGIVLYLIYINLFVLKVGGVHGNTNHLFSHIRLSLLQRTAGDIFTWIKGSKRQNIRAVHDAVHITDPDVSILEISSASVQPEGEAVSSLRLLLHLDSVAQDVPISTVFEAAKVFEHGGPFADLFDLRTAQGS